MHNAVQLSLSDLVQDEINYQTVTVEVINNFVSMIAGDVYYNIIYSASPIVVTIARVPEN